MNMLLEEYIKHKAELIITEKESKTSNTISSASWDDVLLSIKTRRSTRSHPKHGSMDNDCIDQSNPTDNNLADESHTISSGTSSTYSLFSVNTDYSCVTKDIYLNHSKHSLTRSAERQISDDLIRKCLKYG